MMRYWIQVLMITITSIQIVKLLQCDSEITDRQDDEKFKQIYWKCLRNQTGHTTNNNKSTIDSKSNRFDKVEFNSDDYRDYDSNEYQDESHKERGNGKDIIRVRRQNNYQRHGGHGQRNNNNNHNNKNNNNKQPHKEYDTNFNTECMVQCVFQELGLVNYNQFPDKNKLINFMVGRVIDLEFRDFVIESVGECFHYIEYNNIQDKCEFSRSLESCLTEKANNNCEHWDKKIFLF